MISRKNRFHGLGSLRPIYRNSRQLRLGPVNLRYVANRKALDYRAAVVVSKKVHKSAVVRNRIRRRIYEQIRVSLKDSPKSYDMIFTVFDEEVASMSASKLENTIKTLLKRAKIL